LCESTDKKRKKKDFNEIDLISQKTNRSKNRILLLEINPVGSIRVATNPLLHFMERFLHSCRSVVEFAVEVHAMCFLSLLDIGFFLG
jgi:hypothetical protein